MLVTPSLDFPTRAGRARCGRDSLWNIFCFELINILTLDLNFPSLFSIEKKFCPGWWIPSPFAWREQLTLNIFYKCFEIKNILLRRLESTQILSLTYFSHRKKLNWVVLAGGGESAVRTIFGHNTSQKQTISNWQSESINAVFQSCYETWRESTILTGNWNGHVDFTLPIYIEFHFWVYFDFLQEIF